VLPHQLFTTVLGTRDCEDGVLSFFGKGYKDQQFQSHTATENQVFSSGHTRDYQFKHFINKNNDKVTSTMSLKHLPKKALIRKTKCLNCNVHVEE